jgi:hypothetical protein
MRQNRACQKLIRRMSVKSFLMSILFVFVINVGCKEERSASALTGTEQGFDVEHEKQAIIETLNNETKSAFGRDYEGWTRYWVHDNNITKTYINFSDSTFSESLGWEEIRGFVKEYFKKHPAPEPVPQLIDKIDVRLYGTGAWVSYEQQDSLRGLKRETRLMEKVNGEWKIAGMQTTIYGSQTREGVK